MKQLVFRLGCAAAVLVMLMLDATAEAGVEPEPLPLADLRKRYADAASQFIEVDGVEIHYKDEGTGFPVLLLHASWMNLESWRHVSSALTPKFRVIRFDFPAAGLSGIESKEPQGGRFNLIERNVEIVEKLTDHLKLDQLNLVATSSGGSVGFRFASYHPKRVNRMILINSAGMPRTRQTDPNRERQDVAEWRKMKYKPREFWEYSIGLNFPSPQPPPDWFVDVAYDINRRLPAADLARYFFETGQPKKILSKITAPTLVLWGMDNPTVMHLEADVISHWMTSAPTLIKKYPGLGHYPYVEAPEQVIPDILAFFDGTLDAQLRQTVREKVSIEAR